LNIIIIKFYIKREIISTTSRNCL